MTVVEPAQLAATKPDDARPPDLELRLISAIRELIADALSLEESFAPELALVHPEHADGARNLLHYLAVRQRDIRELQRELAALGLSSLGRMERCVLSTLYRVEAALLGLRGEVHEEARREGARRGPVDLWSGDAALERHTRGLLGPTPQNRSTRIMVTLAVDDDEPCIESLMRAGMNVARINCSKGEPDDWLALVTRIKRISESTRLPCTIAFDLAGPNPRTASPFTDKRKLGKVVKGDRLLLLDGAARVERARRDYGKLPLLGCTMPEVVAHLEPSQRVSYDDGKLELTVLESEQGIALLEVAKTAKAAVKLKPQKGLNFPDSVSGFPALTDKDSRDLDFIAQHADVVGLSFVRHSSDVALVQSELAKRSAAHLGVLLKIETTPGFNELGRLLLTAMQSERVGLMLARGDLAMEMGYVRLAEAQEEVLWFGEAALVPVVWATQVLENLSKTGVPSRAEVTDAAMSGRAECVMLNRGEYSREAVAFLDAVLVRMRAHQDKKRAMLRRLQISDVAPKSRADPR